MGLVKYFRGAVLSVMFLLTVGASCSSDSYDPNPWDDIPPVVTVDFNFVKPPVVSTQDSHHSAQRFAISAVYLPLARASQELEFVAPFAITPNQARPGTPLCSPLRT